jgi:triosephosphate isomerase
MIFVNFKTYQQGTGQKALQLVKICQKIAEKEKIEIIPVVQAVDIFRISQSSSLPVWTQHLDEIGFGANTGRVLAEAVLAAGASGAILNHSENKIPTEIIRETVERAKSLGLRVLVCSESVEEAGEIIKSKPDFLGYEPPEFIGSQKDSVATARPGVIADFVKKFPALPIIIGAGIHSRQDVEIGLKLGAKGILVASGVVLAKEPEKKLTDLAKGFK